LIGMGVLPLQFEAGESVESLGLTGKERFSFEGLSDDMLPRSQIKVRAKKEDGSQINFTVTTRLDTPIEVNYYRNGGILHTVLRNMAS
jgi:aconitate hydratase